MEVTRKDIMGYHLLESLIEKNKQKLERYRNNEPNVSIGKVFGSSKDFPYTPCSFTVGGSDANEYAKWKEWNEKCRHLELLIKSDIERMVRIKSEIDELMASIEDPDDKFIFEATMDRKSQEWIAEQLNMDQSCISRRIKKYLEN